MSLIARCLPSILNISRSTPNSSSFHSVSSAIQKLPLEQAAINPGGLFGLITRSVIRVHFPRPNERMRIRKHGWKKRLSTPEGRRILMNRILKGRWIYSH